MSAVVAGVDVGGRRKGFHVALLDGSFVHAPEVGDVLAAVAQAELVGIDSPAAPAAPGERSRRDERDFAAAGICGIRYTPDEATLRAPHPTGYYDWILRGLELHAALGDRAIECFPTATLTRRHGPRAGRSRAAWSRAAQVPGANQDERDAHLAALTAGEHLAGRCERFGAIVVPRTRT